MKRLQRFGSAVSLFLAVCLAAAMGIYILSRAFFTSGPPLMRGGELVSPDGRFLASLKGVYDEVFLGKPKTYYLFEIYRRERNVDRVEARQSNWVSPPLKAITIDNPPGQRHRMVRGRPPFEAEWSEDSSELSIHFFDTTFVMKTFIPSEDQPMHATGSFSEDSSIRFYDLRIQVGNSVNSVQPLHLAVP